MKADLFPTEPGLCVPSWVPEPIARRARDRQFSPLLHDPRMRNVWDTLSHRRNGTFEYPASASITAANAEERQGAAMVQLFHYVVMAAKWPGTITTRSKAERKRRRFLAKAEELRTDAERWQLDAPPTTPFGLWSDDDGPDECVRRLIDASQAYEEIAAKAYAADMWLARDRGRADGDVQWFALAVADKFRALFGSPMYGLTATITSVALGREIDPHTVRHWCAHPPAVKPQKIAP